MGKNGQKWAKMVKNGQKWPKTVIHHPSSIIHHPSSIIHHPPSIIHHPSSIIHHPSSIIHHPSSIIHHPSSIIHHPSSFIHHPSSIIHHPMRGRGLVMWSEGQWEASKKYMVTPGHTDRQTTDGHSCRGLPFGDGLITPQSSYTQEIKVYQHWINSALGPGRLKTI